VNPVRMSTANIEKHDRRRIRGKRKLPGRVLRTKRLTYMETGTGCSYSIMGTTASASRVAHRMKNNEQ
jgi:hypothetical protein